MQVFRRSPFYTNDEKTKRYLSKYVLKENLPLYVVRTSIANNFPDYYWTTNLNNKIVRGTICLQTIPFESNLEMIKQLKQANGIKSLDEYDEMILKSIWEDIRIQTGYLKEEFEKIELMTEFSGRSVNFDASQISDCTSIEDVKDVEEFTMDDFESSISKDIRVAFTETSKPSKPSKASETSETSEVEKYTKRIQHFYKIISYLDDYQTYRDLKINLESTILDALNVGSGQLNEEIVKLLSKLEHPDEETNNLRNVLQHDAKYFSNNLINN